MLLAAGAQIPSYVSALLQSLQQSCNVDQSFCPHIADGEGKLKPRENSLPKAT